MADSAYQLQRINYTHDALIDEIVKNPFVSQQDLARTFGYTQGWFSRVVRSDAFKERIAARKAELVDPLILQSLDERFEALAARSAEILMERLEQPNVSADVATKALEISSRALGYGAQKTGVTVNAQFVVAMPAKSVDSAAWVTGHSPVVLPASAD